MYTIRGGLKPLEWAVYIVKVVFIGDLMMS